MLSEAAHGSGVGMRGVACSHGAQGHGDRVGCERCRILLREGEGALQLQVPQFCGVRVQLHTPAGWNREVGARAGKTCGVVQLREAQKVWWQLLPHRCVAPEPAFQHGVKQ